MVSVIIPTYGGGESLGNVIESILRQTYKNIEIIVVDDNGSGSENRLKTAKALKEYVDNGKVQYITPEKNVGGSGARNTGARASKGKYLMFLDDDDTVSEDKIEKQVKALNTIDKSYGIAYCSTKVFENGKLSNIIEAKESGDILYRYMLGKVYIGTGTALIFREVWESLGGYDESFVRHQDWEFFARVLDKYDAIAVPNAYFNRYITNRNLPKKLDVLEKHTDHYIKFLKKYDFRLPKSKMNRIINMNNSRIALYCLKNKDYKRFFKVLTKYTNLFVSLVAFVRFGVSVCADRIIGKRS